MATLDRDTGRLVVRVAYDGPPLAGKTASLRALGVETERTVTSFDEAYGRTLWFDWMHFRGGRFDGRPIECELAALPGQQGLAARRDVLLADADVIVFVADASPQGHQRTVEAFRRLSPVLTGPRAPGLVVQANKQDLPGALDAAALRRTLALAEQVDVVETVAADRVGIRHAFVFAIRAAVRRAEQIRRATGTLPVGDGPRSPQQVLGRLQTVGQQREAQA